MALQTSISQYFSNRKRHAVEDVKQNHPASKVLILEENFPDVSKQKAIHEIEESSIRKDSPTIDQFDPDVKIYHRKKILVQTPQQPKKTPKSASSSKIKKQPRGCGKQADIRKSLFPTPQLPTWSVQELDSTPESKASEDSVELSENCLTSTRDCSENSDCIVPEAGPICPLDKLNGLRKDLGLGDVKAKLTRSSRIGEIRSALDRLKQGHEKLKAMQGKTSSNNPSLKEFKTIQLEVPTSPAKSMTGVGIPDFKSPSKLREMILKSPMKAMGTYVSPRKLFEEMSPVKVGSKSPAYQKYCSLTAGRPTLVLPFKYRTLAEVFRSVDTVVSIMYNRNETIVFSRLKSSVQELSKKNLSETHLGQIKAVLPNAFKFSQEKVRQFGSNHGTEKYDLVITPIFDSIGNDEDEKDQMRANRPVMTPSILLHRKRQFYEALLKKVKERHEEYLKGLDPPMVVPADKLTRWHPEFDVDSSPDILPAELPQSTAPENYSTARDVLNKARDMFMANPRMEKALQRISEVESAPRSSTSAASAIPALTNALKGIPKSLLEKVRAKQAAKTLEMLTQNDDEKKISVQMGRLPELARILRNLFIGEKKTVLPKDHVLHKLCSSYREILSPSEMETHLNLLTKNVPNWLVSFSLEKKNFVKMTRNVDMTDVMTTLQALVAKNSL